MPWKFRKSFKIAPGIKVNLSKSGLSTTLGKKGASVNVGKRGVRTTVGIPGTGISNTSKVGGSDPTPARKKSSCCSLFVLPIILLPVLLWIVN